MIIWAGSFPRSGSTLWRIAWHRFTGLPTYSYANDPIFNKPGYKHILGQEKLPRPWERMAGYEAHGGIYLIKTHQHPSAVDPENRNRKLFIVRDVRDTVVSLAHYTSWRKKLEFAKELQRIVDNTQWLHFCNAWMPATKVIIRYEELRVRPFEMVKGAVETLGIPAKVTERPMPEFKQLHNGEPRFFRRGIVGGWRGVLSNEQEATLWAQFGEKMTELGYER